MDSIASAISPALEDEEIIMDQLKEWVHMILNYTTMLPTINRVILYLFKLFIT